MSKKFLFPLAFFTFIILALWMQYFVEKLSDKSIGVSPDPSVHELTLPELKLTPKKVKEHICKLNLLEFSPYRQTFFSGAWTFKTNCLFSETSGKFCQGTPVHKPTVKQPYFNPDHIAWSQDNTKILAADAKGHRYNLEHNFQSYLQTNEKSYDISTGHVIVYNGVLPEGASFDVDKFKSSINREIKDLIKSEEKLSKHYTHFITNGKYIGSLTHQRETGTLFYLNPSKGVIINTYVSRYLVNKVLLLSTYSDDAVLLLDGVPMLIGDPGVQRDWLAPLDVMIYPRAIIDNDQHHVIGWISVGHFKLDPDIVHKEEFRFLYKKLDRIYKSNNFSFINAVKYYSEQNILQIDGLDKSQKKVRYVYKLTKKNHTISNKIICSDLKLLPENVEGLDSTINSEVFKIGTPKNSLAVLKLKDSSDSSKKALVLYLRGGPKATIMSANYGANIKKAFPLNKHDIIMFDYSGALGASRAITQRLIDSKELALENDTETIKNYIEKIRLENYSSIILVSSSLSGLMAMKIANESHQNIDQLILLAPWTHYLSLKDLKSKNPRTFLGLGKKQQIAAAFKTTNLNVFGINEKLESDSFRDWMEKIRSEFNPKIPVLVLEAEFENRIDIHTAEKYFNQFDAVEYKVMPKQYHDLILAYPETTNTIRGFLKGNALIPPRSPRL